MLRKRTLADLDLKGKRVFVRVDFNVPQREDGSIEDDTRIRASLPTIQRVLDGGGIAILASHFGRPKGKADPKYKMDEVGKRLSELLKRPVTKLSDCVGPQVKAAVMRGKPGEIFLLENLRFHSEEEKNDPGFSKELADLAELYVNDAFGASHRAHASIVGVAKHLLSAAGLLLEKEIAAFDRILNDPPRPFTAILGGAKVSDKIEVLKNLVPKCDVILIGGGMAYTFLKAQGIGIGKSLVEDDKIELAKEILAAAKERAVEFHLPKDHVIADRFAADATHKIVEDAIPDGWMGLDIGMRTQGDYAYWIRKSKAILWNGPMGVFEMEPFKHGTEAVAKSVCESGALTVVGGGDSVAALESLGLTKRISHVSTGGGASLEMLEGKELPGIAALQERK